jgi:hypothetical protein
MLVHLMRSLRELKGNPSKSLEWLEISAANLGFSQELRPQEDIPAG